MRIYLASFAVSVRRHERFATVFVFDDEEYVIRHSDVRLKKELLKLPVGALFEAQLHVELDAVIEDESQPVSLREGSRPLSTPLETGGFIGEEIARFRGEE